MDGSVGREPQNARRNAGALQDMGDSVVVSAKDHYGTPNGCDEPLVASARRDLGSCGVQKAPVFRGQSGAEVWLHMPEKADSVGEEIKQYEDDERPPPSTHLPRGIPYLSQSCGIGLFYKRTAVDSPLGLPSERPPPQEHRAPGRERDVDIGNCDASLRLDCFCLPYRENSGLKDIA